MREWLTFRLFAKNGQHGPAILQGRPVLDLGL
jgi:hypothetical protein